MKYTDKTKEQRIIEDLEAKETNHKQ